MSGTGTKEIADMIAKVGARFVDRDIKAELINNAEILYKQAIKFISALEQIIAEYEHTAALMTSSGSRESLVNLKLAIHTDENRLQQAIKAQYYFEEKVNEFLGRQIHLAWVDIKTGKIYLIDEIAARTLYSGAHETGINLRGGYVMSNQTEVEEFKNKLTQLDTFVNNKYKSKVNERINKHKQLMRVAIKRHSRNRQSSNRWYSTHKDTVFWQKALSGADKWGWSEETKPGFISQAYVDLIFNSTENLQIQGDDNFRRFIYIKEREDNIGRFTDFIGKGDAIPGIVKGDIIVNNTGDSIHIAVKSTQRFSTAGLGAYIAVAYKIIAMYNEINGMSLNTENLQKYLTGMQRYTTTILASAQAEAEEAIKNELSKVDGLRLFV